MSLPNEHGGSKKREEEKKKTRTVTKDGPAQINSAYWSMVNDRPGAAMQTAYETANARARKEQSYGNTELDDRIAKTLTGGAKAYTSSLLDSAGVLGDAVSQASAGFDYTAGANDRKDAPIVTTSAYDDGLRALQDAAQWLNDSSAADIAAAKDGLGGFGQFLVDLGVEGVKRGGDALATAAIPGAGLVMMGARTFGDASRQAREVGAAIGGQILYGAGRALTATQIEKWFDGLNGLYGKGDLDKIVKELAEKLRGNEMKQKLAKAILDDTGEALESLVTSVADQLLKSVYNNDSIEKNFANTEWGRVRRKALIDAVLNVLSGDSGMVE